MQVIQLGSSSRQGKDLFADYFIQAAEKHNKKVFRIAYANELKNIVAKQLNVTLEQLDFMKNNDGSTVNLLVTIANKIREENPLFFVNHVEEKLKWAEVDNFDYAIVTDLRFPEEWKTDALKIKLIRPGFEPKSKNDKLLDDIAWDIYIKNEFSKEDLATQAYSVFKKLENKM